MNRSLLSLSGVPAMAKLVEAVRLRTPIAVTGLTDDQAAFVASSLAEESGLRVLLVSPNETKAVHAYEDMQQLLSSSLPALLPGGELDLARSASSHDGYWTRLGTLSRLSSGDVRVLSASVEALMQRMGPVDEFRNAPIRLRQGDIIGPDELLRRLMRIGYENTNIVEGKGQCCLRGAILDVYPPNEPSALRVEFFDDEIDSIRTFDCISQRSQDHLDEALLTPATEVLLPEGEAVPAAERMRNAVRAMSFGQEDAGPVFADLPPIPEDDEDLPDYFDQEVAPKAARKSLSATREAELEHRRSNLLSYADLVAAGMPFRRIRTWLTVLTDHTCTLVDWFRPDVVLLSEPDQLRNRAAEYSKRYAADLLDAINRAEAVREQETLLMDWSDALLALNNIPLLTLSTMLLGQGGISVTQAVNLDCHGLVEYASQFRLLAQDCSNWLTRGLTVALLTGSVARGQRLQQTLAEFGVNAVCQDKGSVLAENQINILPVMLNCSFIWPEAGLVVVSDTTILGTGYRKSKSHRSTGDKISAFTELKPGDYVVHEDHGVGIYEGTVQMQNEGTFRDYLLIRYAGTDKLYVPVELLSRIQRYIGNPNQPPKLNRIGGTDWQRQKSKVRAGLKKLAFDLVALYAQRQKSQGHAFTRDIPWQQQFDDMFPYDLTPDQARSVQEIFEDMESPRNMDRLLCGDVGYGKTEVSLRAAFKAVMDSKQVAILAPTTILAQQHYRTVLKRFAGFPVQVRVLSRLVSPRAQREILAEVAEGKVDILVGTHRLLAKDVKFKDLGLLIVDEEQRFGVAHKEAIKDLRRQMDVLTLSATPIPRTLHMSMVGIRDMSLLETPPEARLPVQTHVVEYSDALIADAIMREIRRGGQVYFLYNRVRSIERFYQHLRALVPTANIGVAHGQMKESGLEDVMMDFYNGSYNVLLCTTIIESGLDVPTANTLIVYDADRFGLSQLYQLRGRVGRSTEQGYAYFTVRQDKMISETAQQRLSAIREFTEFGSGFRIAMRDLEIRGAGNILGPEQHGHLATVGYEMYCKLIEETMAEVQGRPVAADLETRVDLKVDAFLPSTYIQDEHQRMEMYRRIAALSDDADREDILDELIDRFGDTPPQVASLLNVAQMRYMANSIGASLVSRRGGLLTLRIEDRFVTEPMLLLGAMKAADPRLVLSGSGPSLIQLKATFPDDYAMLAEGVKVMRRLTDRYRVMLDARRAQTPPAN